MSDFMNQADTQDKEETVDHGTIGVTSNTKDDCSDLTDVNNQDLEDEQGESAPKPFPRRVSTVQRKKGAERETLSHDFKSNVLPMSSCCLTHKHSCPIHVSPLFS